MPTDPTPTPTGPRGRRRIKNDFHRQPGGRWPNYGRAAYRRLADEMDRLGAPRPVPIRWTEHNRPRRPTR